MEAIITAFLKGFLENTIKFSFPNFCNFSYAHKYFLLLLRYLQLGICYAVARCQHSTLSQQLLIYKCLQLWYRVHKLRPKFLICDGCNKIQDYNSYAKYHLVAKYNFYFYNISGLSKILTIHYTYQLLFICLTLIRSVIFSLIHDDTTQKQFEIELPTDRSFDND